MPSAFRHVILTRFSPTDCLAVSFNFTLPYGRLCLLPALAVPCPLSRSLTVPLLPFPLYFQHFPPLSYVPFSPFPLLIAVLRSLFPLSRSFTVPFPSFRSLALPLSPFSLFLAVLRPLFPLSRSLGSLFPLSRSSVRDLKPSGSISRNFSSFSLYPSLSFPAKQRTHLHHLIRPVTLNFIKIIITKRKRRSPW